jgi:hypothetical protein
MKDKFTFNLDAKRFDIRVSFVTRLVGADSNPVIRSFEDIVNDFLMNPIYGAEIAGAKKLKDPAALQEFKNGRASFIGQCIVKNGVDKKDIILINNIVKVDIDLKNERLVEVVFPLVKVLFGPYALAIYRTISGRGLQADILIDDPEKKSVYYDKISAILTSHLIPVDDCFKNVVQKSVLSYDQCGFFNSVPEPFTGSVDPEIEAQVRELTGRQDKSRVKSKNEKEEGKEPVKKKAIRFIGETYDLRRNLLTHEVELNGEPISDYEINSIAMDANDACINVDKSWVASYLGSSRVKSYHPLLELIEKYKNRDYAGAIDKVSSCVITKEGSRLDHAVFFKKWRVKGIAQVFDNSVSNELCPIYIGPPGVGKTFFVTNLYSGELERYHAVLPLVKNKDFSLELTCNLQITDDEYRARKLDDENYFKSVLSLVKVRVRRPYDQNPVHRKRIASMCASSNDTAILKDENRRVIPILVEGFKWDEFNAINKIDLFLDSYFHYKNGFDYNLTREETCLLKDVSRDFEITNTEEEMILLFFPKAHSVEAADEFLTVSQIISLASTYSGGTRLTPYRVTSILNRHAYPQKTITVHSSKTGEKTSRLRGWGVKQVDLVEIAQLFMAKDMSARKYINID